MRIRKKHWCLPAGCLSAFVLWTVAVCVVDVQPIGPNGSQVGLATLNGWFHRLTGVHLTLYTITDWLGLVPIAVCFGFAVLGLCQWIKCKSIGRVDRNILLLGGFYIVTIAAYLLFESVVINYRPVLIEGCLEPSYPSSTTLLTLCVMPTAMMQLHHSRWVTVAIALFMAFMVTGRVLSGVHWLSDIVGGVLLSGGLVFLYAVIAE